MKEESKYKVGDKVNFSRNEKIKSNNTTIVGVEENTLKGFCNLPTFYLIENENGFLPSNVLILKYKFDAKKKYMFVKESEVTTSDNG